MTRTIGAIDQGTTSTRFIVFDRTGATIAMAQREHQQIYPRPGWVEHDPAEILRNTRAVITEALQGAGLTARDLAAVGITNQRETTVLWERATGAPVHNALGVAGYARRSAGGRIRTERRTGSFPCRDGAAAGELFQRAEAALAAGQRAGRARRAPRRAIWHSGRSIAG